MASKGERRRALKEQKRAEALEKSRRQFADPPVKIPIQHQTPEPLKKVPEASRTYSTKKIPSSESDWKRENMEWSDDLADLEGVWGWGDSRAWDQETYEKILIPFLAEYEKKTWNQIEAESTGQGKNRRRKHISYPVGLIQEEAQSRLKQLGHIDLETIFRFRISGKKRLYGIQRAHMFYVLWFDLNHKIYAGSTG